MGWYSLYRWFIQWSKRPYINRIEWFKQHLYDEWFNSLSENEQRNELQRQADLKQRRKEQCLTALACLGTMYNQLDRSTNGSLGVYSEILRDMTKSNKKSNKYHN